MHIVDEGHVELIDLIYDAPFAENGWEAALLALSRQLGDTSVLFGIQALSGLHQVEVTQSVLVDPELVQGIESIPGSLEVNPWIQCYVDAGLLRPFSFEQMISERSDKHAEFEAYLQSHGYTYYHGMTIETAKGAFVPISLLRTRSQMDFDTEDDRLLRLVGPHMRRAARTFMTLRQAEAARQTYEGALWSLDRGVILVDRECSIVFINEMAKRIIDRGDGLLSRQGRLEAAKPAERADLARLVGGAIGTNERPGVAEGISLSRPNGGSLASLVCPVPVARRGAFECRPSAMILCQAPASWSGTVGTLARLHGFSPRQAQLAEMLVRGERLPDASHELGMAYETGRTHLKRMLEKTSTHSQSELVAKIVSGPAPSSCRW